MTTGNVRKACDTLKKLGDTQYAPGVVSTLVALYTNIDDVDSALEVLDAAVDWYKMQEVSYIYLFELKKLSKVKDVKELL